jgi:DnaJ family protein C protein 19
MLWLLLGTAVLALLILGLRAFERASVGSVVTLLKWVAAFVGIALAILLLLSGRAVQALGGLVFLGPLLWRRWGAVFTRFGGGAGSGGSGGGGFTGAGQPPPSPPPPPRTGSAMTRKEAFEVLGLKPGATSEDIHAAHRRLMRRAHPDTGGSDWLASRVNQARDVLLG